MNLVIRLQKKTFFEMLKTKVSQKFATFFVRKDRFHKERGKIVTGFEFNTCSLFAIIMSVKISFKLFLSVICFISFSIKVKFSIFLLCSVTIFLRTTSIFGFVRLTGEPISG